MAQDAVRSGHALECALIHPSFAVEEYPTATLGEKRRKAKRYISARAERKKGYGGGSPVSHRDEAPVRQASRLPF